MVQQRTDFGDQPTESRTTTVCLGFPAANPPQVTASTQDLALLRAEISSLRAALTEQDKVEQELRLSKQQQAAEIADLKATLRQVRAELRLAQARLMTGRAA
jgi:septal ring factor EnvC (AmiA/AmiB activator)